MSALERRYRRLLHALPRPYRDRWSEEMVETLLHGRARAHQPDRLDGGEMLSVLRLAIQLRLGLTGDIPRYRTLGATLRMVALLGLLLQASLATIRLVLPQGDFPMVGPVTAFAPTALLDLGFIPVFVATIAGFRRTAGTLGGLLGVLLVGRFLPVFPYATSLRFETVDVAVLAAAMQLLPLCALVAFRASTPVAHPLRWLLAWPTLAAVAHAEYAYASLLGLWVDDLTIPATVLGLGLLVLWPAHRRHTVDPALAVAVTVLAGIAFTRVAIGMARWLYGGLPDGVLSTSPQVATSVLAVWFVQATVFLAVALLAARTAHPGHSWRRRRTAPA